MQTVIHLAGYFILTLGGLLAAPLLVSIITDDGQWHAYAASLGFAIGLGGILILAFRTDVIRLSIRRAFALTICAWSGISVLGALPLILGQTHLSLTDSLFESVSGLTTTGATVLTGLDSLPPSLLLWRSLLQWTGGIGIIAMGIVILPFLKVGGMQIFRAESSDRSDKLVARPRSLATRLLIIYVGFTIACGAAYLAAGMTPFDALNHAMTTISTGGFSTHDASMGHFQSPLILWIGSLFMILGSLPFTLFILVFIQKNPALLFTSQVKGFFLILIGVMVVLALWLDLEDGLTWFDALTHGLFNTASVMSTTGYASADYLTWGTLPVILFFFLTFIGGCSGSTAGGFKIYRIEIMAMALKRGLRLMLDRHVVLPMNYAGKPIGEDVTASVGLFVTLYGLTIFTITLILSLIGLDFETAFSGAATAVANVGPGIGEIIGPAGNFQSLPDAAKWALIVGMLLGRLEIVTVAVMLMPSFWSPSGAK